MPISLAHRPATLSTAASALGSSAETADATTIADAVSAAITDASPTNRPSSLRAVLCGGKAHKAKAHVRGSWPSVD